MKLFIAALLLIFLVVLASLSGIWPIAYFSSAAYIGYAALEVIIRTKYSFASRRWPTAPTQRVRARVEDTEDIDDGSSTRTLKVRYRYEVNGIAYQGQQLRFPFGIVPSVETMPSQAKQINGKRSLARYHPQKPEISVLQPGLSLLDGIALTVFFLCAFPLTFALLMLGVNALS
ncbi:DUF3592 domain-containing protein [Aquabacterium soli]|uniref:DUF3592 domain-containing protein n=1 Tax=Aquabacterium soli TaxID=2493092 RepID=A0A3R8S555_9BURK|nr:DUF3592 domain-containing protein [Aquabacterium soli]RRR99892.1 DUF3592 domain-containing protein [Aquabacterium soli]